MSCHLFRSRAVAYADGELPPEEARAIRDHARACAECGAELAAVEHEGEIYAAALRGYVAPADLTDGVMDAIEHVHLLPREPAAPAATGIPLRWVLSTAAAAAAVLLLVMGGMGASLRGQRAATAADLGWRIIPATEAVQVEGYRPAPSGGLVYASEPEPPRSRPRYEVRFASVDGSAIHQAAPAFEVEEAREAGEPMAMNKAMGRPDAVTEADRQQLNASPAAGAPGGMWYMSPQPASSASAMKAGGGPPGSPRAASDVVVDSTDAKVTLTITYERDQDRYVTLYDADFTADYVIRAPDAAKKATKIVATFPFPNGCDTVSGSKLLVDEKPDEDHTSYSIAGIRWVNWFKPQETKTISIAYRARGQGNYRYVLDKVNLTRRLRFLMRIDGIERGREIELPPDALAPGRPPTDVPGRWDYAWDYSRLLTTKDIAVNFPTKESPSVAAGRVMETVGRYLTVARLAPIMLVVFLGALALGGLWNREQALKIEELGLLGIAFLLFYPLFLFGAGYIGRDPALCAAVAVVVVLSAAYLARSHDTALAARAAVLEIVLLGAFTYALFDKALTGLIFTVGATLLLAYFMLMHGRRTADALPGDPASVARAEMPRPADTSAEEDHEV